MCRAHYPRRSSSSVPLAEIVVRYKYRPECAWNHAYYWTKLMARIVYESVLVYSENNYLEVLESTAAKFTSCRVANT